MCTDNSVLLRKSEPMRTIICMQKRAAKKVPTEEDIIAANILAFNDDIGIVTNHVTGMIEARAGFEPSSREYAELTYRIMCGQQQSQNCIDRAKGIICKDMPVYWHSYRDAKKIEDPEFRGLCEKICAPYKPYFMIYIYPALKAKYQEYQRNKTKTAIEKFRKYRIRSIGDIKTIKPQTEQMKEFLAHYNSNKKIGENPCTVNRICWLFEKEFPDSVTYRDGNQFDYSILKSGVQYSRHDYNAINELYLEYSRKVKDCIKKASRGDQDSEEATAMQETLKNYFIMRAQCICPNEDSLCDIVLDICYQRESSKQFAWEIAGDTIIRNLLKRNGWKMRIPVVGGSEFTYGGEGFNMVEVDMSEGCDGSYSE